MKKKKKRVKKKKKYKKAFYRAFYDPQCDIVLEKKRWNFFFKKRQVNKQKYHGLEIKKKKLEIHGSFEVLSVEFEVKDSTPVFDTTI